MKWLVAHRFDRDCVALADRHYNRQTIGSPQFVPPGACIVLKTYDQRAVWVTSWPRYVMHAWPGAWINTTFRNEGAGLSSELIRDAIAATRDLWRTPPDEGVVSFIDPSKVRRKRDPGRCYLRAGFVVAGRTQKGLLVLHLARDRMPDPVAPLLELEAAL